MKDVIVQDGAAVLREEARPVAEQDFGTEKLDALVERMARALDDEKDGVALAAPQIGEPFRIFVVRYDRTHAPDENASSEPEVGVYINPELVRVSRKRQLLDEGCLSVRRVYGKTLRHERATVRARLPDGTPFERGGGGLLAQIFQHEMDHLDGILFTDHAEEVVEISEEEYARHRAHD